MAGKVKSYNFVTVLALIAIAFPMLLAFLKDDNKPNLTGLVITDSKPEVSLKTWLDASYQDEMDDYNADHWSFKELSVRLNNQFYYKVFNQIRVNGFVIGKNDYVFSESYIFSTFGDDLMKTEKVNSLLEMARVVQDSLKRKGIDLLLVYAPGKGVACKEFIEDKYVHPVTNTNHNQFVTKSKELGLNHLDLYSYFENIKTTAPYPLFPKFGHHWSYYGECLAVDTIIHHIENLHQSDLPDIFWKEIDVVDSARHRDADVLKSMNLYANPAQNMQLAYPQILFESDPQKNNTRVLTVSDSYWYGPVYMGVPQNCFAGGQFWYYNNRVIPSPRQGEKVEVWELDFRKELESNQVVMLLYSDANLNSFGSGFIQDAYEMYTSPERFYKRKERNTQIQTYAKQIRQMPALLKKATLKSKELQIPLDSAIRLDAAKMGGV
jgi:hypothetical protein